MPLMKALIHIPERVQRGDFVLNLSHGLEGEAVQQTLDQYVVTPQLVKAFDDALSFIKSTVVGGQNRQKGAYLHGSFGSGKSHFMAVAHLLMQGHPDARAIPELAPVVSRHDDWLQRQNILLVPYHMIGAPSIEAGILGGYVRHIQRHHPEAPQPGFYLSDRLFRDAQNMREQMGDERFFAVLNQGAGGSAGDDEWGDLAQGWDAVSFDAVLQGRTDDEEKARLVGDLVGTLFRSVADVANSQAGGYVGFDEGLRIMTQHAKGLGYDAVVLFLDELILWLASHIADQQFIAHNIQKVVKLVEPSESRALPMAAFIARQRDLREFVGDQYTGTDQVVLSDALKYWEGRFHTITLEDRNLPVIAQRRLLRPRDESARQQIQAAFDTIDKGLRDEVYTLLLTTQGDRDMFRDLYPFSPALVQALVALSSALQRERTALKVMLMLLVHQRETLQLGGVIPVGDLYDVIASDAEPFSEQMRAHFDNARQLLERKLLPLLEGEHGMSWQDVEALPEDAPRRRAFNTDLRLLKTLLLAALVPEVESFKQLTANKLAALNHGTIKSPIPGQEGRTVAAKCRKWAGQVGEIKISDDAQPVIGIQLSGVDTQGILEQAQIHDNDGARRKLIQDMIFEAFGIQGDGQLFVEHSLLWRGTRRTVEVAFQNIREITDFNTFQARDPDWKVIIGFPFDGDHAPTDARARVQVYEARGQGTRTLCWIPCFLSQAAQRDLGVLVRLEYVLKSDDRFASFSRYLSPVDRTQARTLLENQRSQLRQRLRDCLLGAYGGSEAIPGTLDEARSLDEPVMSLEPGFTPRLPHGVNLRQAFEQLLGQALRFQYPDHPAFETEVRINDLGKVMGELRRAIHANGHRIDVESGLRALMRQIAQPLNLGEMHERHFIFKPAWPNELRRELAHDGQEMDAPLTVARLRAAMDRPRPRGLPEAVQNLLIMVFVEYGQYACLFHGQEYDPQLKDLPDTLVLVQQELAEPAVWKQALDKAGALFGLTPHPLRTANHQNALVKSIHETAQAGIGAADELVNVLAAQLQQLGQPLTGHRFRTAEHARDLLEALSRLDGVALVNRLADVQAPSSDQALGRSIHSAGAVTQLLQNNNWSLLTKIWESGHPGAVAIRDRVFKALDADELVTPLAPVLRQAQREATALIDPAIPTPSLVPEPPVSPPACQDQRVVRQAARTGLTRRQAREVFAQIEQSLGEHHTLDLTWTISTTDPQRSGRDGD